MGARLVVRSAVDGDKPASGSVVVQLRPAAIPFVESSWLGRRLRSRLGVEEVEEEGEGRRKGENGAPATY